MILDINFGHRDPGDATMWRGAKVLVRSNNPTSEVNIFIMLLALSARHYIPTLDKLSSCEIFYELLAHMYDARKITGG